MGIIIILYKVLRKGKRIFFHFFENTITLMIMKVNKVHLGKGFCSNGIPDIDIAVGGSIEIGNNFRMNNGKKYNKIGRQQKCLFIVKKGGKIKIGNNVGMSSTAIVAHKYIEIKDNVLIGGNVVIYDTDFHSLDPQIRRNIEEDYKHAKKKEVIIGNNVFIGAHSIILKGVHIGENSIIGAGSVVVKSILPNEVWGGNPARFIKKI